MQNTPRHGRRGAHRYAGAAALAGLMLLAGCCVSALRSAAPPTGAAGDLDARAARADGWLLPACQAATASWLRHVATVGRAQDRAAARQLLGSGLLPLEPNTHNSSAPPAPAGRLIIDQDPGELGATHASDPTQAIAALAPRAARSSVRYTAGEERRVTARRVQARPAEDSSATDNDGPALRGALVPAEGMEAQWEQVLQWPSDRTANPCACTFSQTYGRLLILILAHY